jgi:uncharacterized membrane protein YhaH (DUF805 family)
MRLDEDHTVLSDTQVNLYFVFLQEVKMILRSGEYFLHLARALLIVKVKLVTLCMAVKGTNEVGMRSSFVREELLFCWCICGLE